MPKLREEPNGNYDEVNIYAEGSKSGKPSFLIGECKPHPGKKDIDKFTRIADRLKKTAKGEIFLFFVGYQFAPDVETYIRNQYPSVRMYKTYEFELKYKRLNLL